MLDWPLATPLIFAGGLAIAYLTGYGLASLLLPAEQRSARLLVSPTLGIAALCWLTFLVSATFRIIVSRAVWWAFLALICLTVIQALFGSNRSTTREITKGLLQSLAVSVPALLCLLWPFFVVGADTYLGTVNPDFTFGLSDAYFVHDRLSNTVGPVSAENSYAPFDNASQRLTVHARYIGNLHGILLEKIFGIEPRTGLTLALALWLFCFPQSIFVLSKVVAGLDNRGAALAALLAGISGPVAMSYALFFVGQNAALPVTPLLFTATFLLLTKPGAKIFGLTLLLFCSLFWIYPTQLPFVVVPAAVLAVYRIWRREITIRLVLGLAAALAGAFVVLHIGLGSFWNAYLRDWVELTGKIVRDNVFLEFLTESFVPMLFGLVCYPPSASPFQSLFGSNLDLLAFFISVAAALGLLAAFYTWAKRVEDRGRAVLWGAIGLLSFLIWWWVTFINRYGYSLLKMMTWIQFAILPIAAFGFLELWRWSSGSGWRRGVVIPGSLLLLGLNLTTSIDYGYKTLGPPRSRAGIVNLFDMSGNQDYLRLARDLSPLVPFNRKIGLLFTNPTQSQWVTYYLRRWPLSVLTFLPFTEIFVWHVEDLPGLPAPTGPTPASPYFHGADDDFYLLPNSRTSAGDFARQNLPEPDWQNRTFELYRADRVHDLIVVGRGFYALEQFPGTGYWWPKSFRWMAQSGELLLVRPSKKNMPYRLSLAVISGYGLHSASRTIEFFHNGQRIGEAAVQGAGRVLSPPFVPAGDVERIVFQIKERVRPQQREKAVWNRQIPSDYRRLNVAVGEVRLATEEDLLSAIPVAARLEGPGILRNAYSFNGIEPDGWLGQSAEAALIRPVGATEMELQFLVPSDAGYRFPYNLVIEVDGVATKVEAAKPGTLLARVALRPAHDRALCHIAVHPAQSYLPAGYRQAARPTIHSIHWDAVRFNTELPSIKSITGVDGDGWVSGIATLQMPRELGSHAVKIAIDLPKWANAPSHKVWIAMDGKVLQSLSFKPGYHELEIPSAALRAGAAFTLGAQPVFSLPLPDTRKASMRLIGVWSGETRLMRGQSGDP